MCAVERAMQQSPQIAPRCDPIRGIAEMTRCRDRVARHDVGAGAGTGAPADRTRARSAHTVRRPCPGRGWCSAPRPSPWPRADAVQPFCGPGSPNGCWDYPQCGTIAPSDRFPQEGALSYRSGRDCTQPAPWAYPYRSHYLRLTDNAPRCAPLVHGPCAPVVQLPIGVGEP